LLVNRKRKESSLPRLGERANWILLERAVKNGLRDGERKSFSFGPKKSSAKDSPGKKRALFEDE